MSGKTIFTGYFARHSGHDRAVSITASKPVWFDGLHCAALAPKWEIVASYKRGMFDEEGYAIRYRAQLDNASCLSPSRTADAIIASLPDGAVLLCYEKPPAFCHRSLAAAWLMRWASPGVLALPIVELVI